MVLDGAGQEELRQQIAAQNVIAKVMVNGYPPICIGATERFQFYTLAATAFDTICTSEQEP